MTRNHPGEPSYVGETHVTAKLIQSLAGFIYIVVGTTAALLFIYRHRKPIKALRIPFCILMLTGVSVSATSMLLIYGKPSHNSCAAIIWLLPVGFGMCWGSLIAKTIRVYSIFNNVHQMEVQKFNRHTITAITGVELIIAFLWWIVDPPRPTIVQSVNDSPSYWTCV